MAGCVRCCTSRGGYRVESRLLSEKPKCLASFGSLQIARDAEDVGCTVKCLFFRAAAADCLPKAGSICSAKRQINKYDTDSGVSPTEAPLPHGTGMTWTNVTSRDPQNRAISAAIQTWPQ